MSNAMLARLAPLLLAAAGLGCGGDGTNRVSGAVTFKGKPVPFGKIYFSPDGAKNNTGSTGFADIRDGRYDTGSTGGRGVGGGAMLVAIEGQEPAAVPKGDVTMTSLFARYETTAEVAGTTTKDFDVPAEAGIVKKGPPGADMP